MEERVSAQSIPPFACAADDRHRSRRRCARILLLGILWTAVFVFGHAQTASAEQRQIKIGALDYVGADMALRQWSPTAEYLSVTVPGRSFKIIPLKYDPLRTAVEKGEVDFVITHTGHYVELKVWHGISPVATVKNLRMGKPYTVCGGVIFTRVDRDDITKLTDLKNKSFIATSKAAFGGFQMAWLELVDQGIDPFKDMSKVTFTGFPEEKIIYAVRDGVADAGTVRTTALEEMAAAGKIKMDDFRILQPRQVEGFPFVHSTRLYPEWAFAKVRHTSDELAEDVVIALLQMSPESHAARAGNNAGWTVSLDYQPVHELFKTLRIGPYQEIGKVTVADIVMQYLPALLLAAVGLLLLIVAMVIVLRLNRRLKQSTVSLENEISERSRAEAKLAENEARLRAIIENEPEWVMLLDRDGNILETNPAGLAILDANKNAQIVGKSIYSFISQEHKSAFRALVDKVFEGGSEVLEFSITSLKDNYRCLEIHAVPLPGANHEQIALLGITRDITERKLAEEQSRQHQAELAHVVRLSTLGEMASTLAHELNQPLSAVVNYTQGCVRRLKAGSLQEKDLLEVMEQASREAKLAGEIVHRLRSLVDKSEPQRQLADVNKIVLEAAELARIEARRHRVDLRLDLVHRPPPIMADIIQIEQVILNLTRNGIEAICESDNGNRELKISTALKETNEIEVAVCDSAYSISEEVKQKLFEPFFTTKRNGMGMGLSISRSIIEAHGGRLWYEHSPKGGSIFEFTLPVVQEEETI
jgi:PAS domain S-box-containing protein